MEELMEMLESDKFKVKWQEYVYELTKKRSAFVGNGLKFKRIAIDNLIEEGVLSNDFQKFDWYKAELIRVLNKKSKRPKSEREAIEMIAYKIITEIAVEEIKEAQENQKEENGETTGS